MKSYKLTTVQAISFLLRNYLSQPGRKTSGEALRIVQSNSFLVGPSSARNIITEIMNELVKNGKAKKLYRGTWEVQAIETSLDYIPRDFAISKKPVVFDPKLTAFLDPPKCTKHVEVYNELKKLKGDQRSRFMEYATILCDKAGISIKRLINYINEQREATRHTEAAGA